MTTHNTRMRFWLLPSILVLLLIVAWTIAAPAELPATIVRVEEDWELVIGTPDPNSDAPQIACLISPVGHVALGHATFELNHQSLPTYVAGGLQLQIWDGETPLSQRKFPDQALLASPGETITWTQSVEVHEDNLMYEITNGNSTTWGPFGGQGYLKAVIGTTLSNLNGYDPNVSVANSGVAYAANRVQSLVLKRIRVHMSTGEQVEDTTQRVVHMLD